MIGEGRIRHYAERALALAKANKVDAIVELSQSRAGNTRFAKGEITSSADVDRVALSIGVQIGQRRASARTNQLDDRALDETVARAVRLAKLAPENAETMPPLGKQKLVPVKGAIDGATERLAPAARAKTVAAALAAAGDKAELAGFYEHSHGARGIATSAGLWAYHAWTSCELSCTARTADGTGSGWAGQSSHRAADLDGGALAARAVQKAAASQKPRRLDPGRYTVVLEPAAASALLSFLVASLDARRADEGRSFFAKRGGGTKVGEKLFPDNITVRADPHDAVLRAAPFDGEGLPRTARAWIDRGVVTGLVYSRFWAKKQGKEPTAHPDGWSLAPININAPALRTPATSDAPSLGINDDVAALVKGVDRGVLITRMWYLRSVDPQSLLVTGLTRDGTFLIERGEIVAPVNNFRFNESPAQMLAHCDALGAAHVPGGSEGAGMRVPVLRTHEFNLASVSEAV